MPLLRYKLVRTIFHNFWIKYILKSIVELKKSNPHKYVNKWIKFLELLGGK